MRYLSIIACLCLFTFPIFSQEYEFEELSDEYEELTDPISFTNQECWDEVNFVITSDLPISEWFGNPVSQLMVQDSRVIVGELTAGNILAPFSTNLVCNAIDPTVSNIGYTVGTDPTTGEKLMKIEWKESGFAYLEGFFDLINFQCWIYESGVIEFHYGVGATSLAEISYIENGDTFGGLCGISNGFTEAYYLEGPSDSYTFKYGPVNPNELPLLTSFPAQGTIYRFSPKQSSSIQHSSFSFNPSLQSNLIQSDLIVLSDQTERNFHYSVFNSNGYSIASGSGTENTAIGLNQISTGIYFIKLVYEGEIHTFKFFKS